MSTGVTDQMKTAGNSGKIKDEQNIPWSQQVDEASNETLTPPINLNENIGSDQTPTQFQYPPFSAKENRNSFWKNFKSRKSDNSDPNKKHGKNFGSSGTKRDETTQPPPATMITHKQSTYDFKTKASEHFSHTDESLRTGKQETRLNSDTYLATNKIIATSLIPKKATWASIASQPAKQSSRTTLIAFNHKKKGPGMPPPPMVPGKHDLEVNVWDSRSQSAACDAISELVDSNSTIVEKGLTSGKVNEIQNANNSKIIEEEEKQHLAQTYGVTSVSLREPRRKEYWSEKPAYINKHQNFCKKESVGRVSHASFNFCVSDQIENMSHRSLLTNSDSVKSSDDYETPANTEEIRAILDNLRYKNNYNPREIDLEKASYARFFVIKSYSEDDIHRSIKYEIWCSTENGNKRLDAAFKERVKAGGNVLLFFSVNGSGHFCGVAQMMTAVDYSSTASVWSQDKWKGKFRVKWIYVKDVPNSNLRHIILENNENKSVTKSRDTQEVPSTQGKEMMQIMHLYNHTTSLFDDFSHYEVRQREEINSAKTVLTTFSNRQSEEKELRSVQNHSGYYKAGNNRGGSFRNRDSTNHFYNSSDYRKYEVNKNLGSQHSAKHQETNYDVEASKCGSRQTFRNDQYRRDGRELCQESNTDKEKQREKQLFIKEGNQFRIEQN